MKVTKPQYGNDVSFNLTQFYLTVNNMEDTISKLLETDIYLDDISFYDVYEEEKSDLFSDEVISIIISVVKARLFS